MTPEARALDHRPVMDHGVRDGSDFWPASSELIILRFEGLNIQIELLIILGPNVVDICFRFIALFSCEV